MTELTEREKRVNDLILETFQAIKDMDELNPLGCNHAELAQAIHVLQAYLKQHVLNRLMPEEFGDWWFDPELEELG